MTKTESIRTRQAFGRQPTWSRLKAAAELAADWATSKTFELQGFEARGVHSTERRPPPPGDGLYAQDASNGGATHYGGSLASRTSLGLSGARGFFGGGR